jgi:hypothetical protein
VVVAAQEEEEEEEGGGCFSNSKITAVSQSEGTGPRAPFVLLIGLICVQSMEPVTLCALRSHRPLTFILWHWIIAVFTNRFLTFTSEWNFICNIQIFCVLLFAVCAH